MLVEEGHTRMPVVDGNLDKVVGQVTARDVITFLSERKLIVLQDIIRPAFFVPTTMKALELLRMLQKRREHLAIAVDEYGGTAGIVTTEDLVEEIVGELFDEDSAEPEAIHAEPGGTWLVHAHVPIRDFNRALDADVPEADFDTIGGLVTHPAGAIPDVGQSFTGFGFELQVVERSERRVKKVRVRRLVEPAKA